MKKHLAKTKKAAASIYIVIFTTTLLGVIALSFTRIMLAESLRTTNYSLSQSAYNSAQAGIEDAKIVLLRYQNCINFGKYSDSTGSSKSCADYDNAFGNKARAEKTAKKCNTVGKFLHGTDDDDLETIVQTTQTYNTDAIDQAYTCVKISAYTEDFLAVLKEDATTKIIPLRAENQTEQNSINRIQIQWFDQDNYDAVRNVNGTFQQGIDHGTKMGKLSANRQVLSNSFDYGYSFGANPVVPPALQVTYMQTSGTFDVKDFYASAGIVDTSPTNRGTLLLRPTKNNDVKTAHKIVAGENYSNVLPQNSLAYSANKSFNTPIDVYCEDDPGNFGGSWSNYACSADFFVPSPINGGDRNMRTNFLVVNLPYGRPETDIAVKMYKCIDPRAPISKKVDDGMGNTPDNCTLVEFANVQPMVDSTGRANDLFRRVEARIELADTSYPISSYALATDSKENFGVAKDFYVTTSPCTYTSTWWANGSVAGTGDTTNLNYINGVGTPGNGSCATASGNNGQSKIKNP